MSFGFGIGDFLATLKLFKAVGSEIKNYRNAPVHFQHLQVELELLQSTLLQVFRMQSTHDDEKDMIERIRAVAMHCHGPLHVFLQRMRQKSGVLGHFGNTRTLGDVQTRVGWSTIAQKDVEDLRKLILAELMAITVLLSIGQMAELNRLGSESSQAQAQSLQVLQDVKFIRKQNDTIFQVVSQTPAAIIELTDVISTGFRQQAQQATVTDQGLGHLLGGMRSLTLASRQTLEVIRARGSQVSNSIARIRHLLRQIQQLAQLLAHYSRDMLQAIAQNTYALLNLARQMKRVIRTIEAIPLHLTLDIIRLDDALGESWGLPFQACTSWQSFKDLLVTVVFGNGRIGASRIVHDKFVVISAKTGRPISPFMWQQLVKAGMHLHQAMVIEEESKDTGTCPYTPCSGVLEVESGDSHGRVCSECGKWSTTMAQAVPLIRTAESSSSPISDTPKSVDTFNTLSYRTNSTHLPKIGPLPRVQLHDDAIGSYRRVQLYETPPEINSIAEADEILAKDNSNAAANRFRGWWHIRQYYDGLQDQHLLEDRALHHLRKATTTDPFDSQSWYLLARLYFILAQLQERPATRTDFILHTHSNLQMAIYLKGSCPDYWLSAGILFYALDQYRDSLDALARAIRFNPNIALVWLDLGILYNCVRQETDVRDAITRALHLEPNLERASKLLDELNNEKGYGASGSEGPLGRMLLMQDTALLHISTLFEPDMGSRNIVINPIQEGSNDEGQFMTMSSPKDSASPASWATTLSDSDTQSLLDISDSLL